MPNEKCLGHHYKTAWSWWWSKIKLVKYFVIGMKPFSTFSNRWQMKPINPDLRPREIRNGCLCAFPADNRDFLRTFRDLRVHSRAPDGGTTKCRTLINSSWLPATYKIVPRRRVRWKILWEIPQLLVASRSISRQRRLGPLIIQSPPLTTITRGRWPGTLPCRCISVDHTWGT